MMRLPKCLRVSVFLMALLGGCPALFAQEEPAILLSGPTLVQGVPLDYPNRIQAWEGSFIWREQVLKLWVILEELEPRDSWSSVSLCSRRFYQFRNLKDQVIYYERVEGFGFFYLLPEDTAFCDFFGPFYNRFFYFQGLQRLQGAIVFPGILDL